MLLKHPGGSARGGRGAAPGEAGLCVCVTGCVCPCSAHALTADVSMAQTAAAAQLFLADGVVLTGTATGHPADPQQLRGESQHSQLGTVGQTKSFPMGSDWVRMNGFGVVLRWAVVCFYT